MSGKFRTWGRRLKGSFYDWLLWITGFRKDKNDEDTISDMLWRQKQRMGAWWWLMPILTILFTAALLAFEIWLVIHIVTLKIKKGVYALRHKAPARRSKAVKATRR